MKIAMIGQKGIPSRAGGVEIHVEEISKRLVAKGHTVDVYCRKKYCNEICKIYERINIKYIPSINVKSLDAITYSFFATVVALFKRYDIIHYHALGPCTMAIIPKLFGIKTIGTVHGLDWQREKWGGFGTKYLKFGEYASAKFCDETITVGKKLVKYYKEKYNKEIHYIPNGVQLGEIKEANIIKRKYGLKKDSYMLFLARLVPEKGCHYLIEAFMKLDNKGKKLVVAGGSSHSSDYEKFLHEIAEDNKDIIFTGFVEGDELKELYSNCYLYVLPSDIEGLPISLLEALSYNNCCLVSDIAECTDVIMDKGKFFKKGNVKDLSKNLQLLIDCPTFVEKYRSGTNDYVCKRYSWDESVNRTIQQCYK